MDVWVNFMYYYHVSLLIHKVRNSGTNFPGVFKGVSLSKIHYIQDHQKYNFLLEVNLFLLNHC